MLRNDAVCGFPACNSLTLCLKIQVPRLCEDNSDILLPGSSHRSVIWWGEALKFSNHTGQLKRAAGFFICSEVAELLRASNEMH